MDRCASCAGLWLDQGELYRFAPEPRRVFEALKEAYAAARPGDRACPRCRTAMRVCRLAGGTLELDACPRCGGNWLDPGELDKFSARFGTGLSAVPAPAPSRSSGGFEPPPRPSALLGLAAYTLAAQSGSYSAIAAALAYALACIWAGDAAAAAMRGAGAGLAVYALHLGWAFTAEAGRLDGASGLSVPGPGEAPEGIVEALSAFSRKAGIAVPALAYDDGDAWAVRARGAAVVFSRQALGRRTAEQLRVLSAFAVARLAAPAARLDDALCAVELQHDGLRRRWHRAALAARGRRGLLASRARGGAPEAALAAFFGLLAALCRRGRPAASRLRVALADAGAAELAGDANLCARTLLEALTDRVGPRPDRGDPEPGPSEGLLERALYAGSDPPAFMTAALSHGKALNRDGVLAAMRWELDNAWARRHERARAFPWPARRLRRFEAAARASGAEPLVVFPFEAPPAEAWAWGELAGIAEPALFVALPCAAAAAARAFVPGWAEAFRTGADFVLAALAVAPMAYLLTRVVPASRRRRAPLPPESYPDSTAAALLKFAPASPENLLPARVRGVYRGKDGLPFSTFGRHVVEDATGYVLVSEEGAEALFAALARRSGEAAGTPLTLEGKFLRDPAPNFLVDRAALGAGPPVPAPRSGLLREAALILVALAAAGGVFWAIGQGVQSALHPAPAQAPPR